MKDHRKSLFILVLIIVFITVLPLAAFAESGDPTGASYTAITGTETVGDVAVMANKAYFGATSPG